ncbi:MAG TPA: hypothetical protein VJ821_19015 [Anaerolineales bacterium]|nr:hypothetical protein [Anaerolineales bacterium]
MNFSQLSLKGGKTAGAAYISNDADIGRAVERLQIPHPVNVIVLVGGAGGITALDESAVKKAVAIVARLAEETGSVVIDGGTQAGIMTEIGSQRKHNGFSFSLVGVVIDSLLARKEAQSALDPNHTHFFLIPGQNWGDESVWISKIATHIAGNKKSITVLVNGGRISRTDVEHSLSANRPAFVMRGTGRMADEITLSRNISAIDISKKAEEIHEMLRARLS